MSEGSWRVTLAGDGADFAGEGDHLRDDANLVQPTSGSPDDEFATTRTMARPDPEPRNDSRFLELARGVLAGKRYTEREFGGSKVLGFVLAPEGSDTLITSSIIKLRFSGAGSIHRYFLDAAPGVVWDLMGRMGVDRVTGPLVGRLRSSGARLRPWPVRGTSTDMVGWVIPGSRGIAIHTRPANSDFPPTGPIPPEGPWALPAGLPSWDSLPWEPPPPKSLSVAPPLRCPHCSAAGTTFRKLGDGVLVCPSCARSFERST